MARSWLESYPADVRWDIDDEPARERAPGEHGEIRIRGPNVMRGYWQQPEATAAALTSDGYFRTGDVGCIDHDGSVFIIERCKDMLLCSGFNVYPRVIEDAIYAHPDVAEVCVIGVADEYRGQSPKAFIKLKDGAPALTRAPPAYTQRLFWAAGDRPARCTCRSSDSTRSRSRLPPIRATST